MEMTNLSWQLLFPTQKRKKRTPANMIFLIVIARSPKHKSLNGSQVSCLSDSYPPCSVYGVRVCMCVCFQPLCFLLKIYKSYFLCHLNIKCIILKVLFMCNTSSTQQQIYRLGFSFVCFHFLSFFFKF